MVDIPGPERSGALGDPDPAGPRLELHIVSAGEDQQMAPLDQAGLTDLQLAEHGRAGQRRQHLPMIQIIRNRMTDDARPPDIHTPGPSRDQHVPPPVVVEEHERIPPRLVVPGARGPFLVPAPVSHHRLARGALEGDAIDRVGPPDALDHPRLGPGDSRVEHPQGPVGLDHRGAGPDRPVIEGGALGVHQGVGHQLPGASIRRHRMPHRRIHVAALRVVQCARGAQEEQVVHDPVINDPVIPHPVVRQSKTHDDSSRRR